MKMKNVEDIYPLSPMQQGILFHSLHDPVFAMYFEIITWTIHGEMDVPAFERAWQQTLERHPILRTAFVWEGLDEPLQVVRQRVKLPLAQHDWRGLSPAEQEARLEQFFATERERGFDLSRAPLMRIALIRTSDNTSRFVWSYHHGLIDGWSGSLVFNDVFIFYEALSHGREIKLKPGRPFRDYIEWVRQQDLSQAEVFWRQTLKGFTAATAISVRKEAARSGAVSDASRSYREQQDNLSAESTQALVALARRHQLTLNTICQGAWAVLLSLYSGERDIVFGVAVSGRPPMLPEVETMVGMLINTLPARVEVTPEAALLPWLKEIQRQQVETRRYEYSPLVQVHGWSDVPRDKQLFESIVSFENHPIDYSLLKKRDGAELRNVVHYHTATGYPLNIIIEPGDQLLVKILYDFGHFDDDTIRRMLGHFQSLLVSISVNPEQRLSDLSLLTAGERRQLTEEWNDIPRVEPRQHCIHQMFEAQAERTPESTALVFASERFSYSELNRRANQLACYLQRLGVGPEVPVALCLQRSAEMVIAMLGILKAGGGYVPLDPQYPQERLAFMLEDSQAPVLLTQQGLLETLPTHGARVVCLDTDWSTIAQESEANVESSVGKDNLAYFIYTSGSTGRPKGVTIAHASAVTLSYWAREVFTPEQLAGVLASTSISFDLSVFELFVPLSWGGKVILAEDALHLQTLAEAGEVTLINTVPSAMAELVRLNKVPASARTINLAGEPLPLRLVQQLYEQQTVQEVFNLYGPSEDTTYSTFTLVQKGTEEAPTIGRPISNTQVYLLDERMQPVPIGVAGELHIGGDGLARGYFNRPDLTAERFIPNPFGKLPGGRLYRTGDLARYLSDGRIEFLGRLDHQVKIRGFRIELGEVETVIEAHAGVRACVVAAREDVPGDKRLVAYLVPSKRQGLPLAQKLTGPEKEVVLGERQQSKLPNGMLVAGHSSLQTSGIYREIFEDKIYLKHDIRLNESDCVFDVGANIGLFTLFVKQQWRDARVYAFEPLPPNFDMLRANVALYGLDVRLFECALSDRSGQATFTFYPHASAMSGFGSHVEEDKVATKANIQSWLQSFAQPAGQPHKPQYELDEFVEQYLQSESYVCQLKTLSEIIRENRIERIDLLKLDVEKSEFSVLAGIEDEDWPKIRQIVIEVHTEELLAQIESLLQRRGYTFAVEKSTLVEESGQDVVRVYMLYARLRAMPESSSNGNRKAASEAMSAEANSQELSIPELRLFLQEKLPDYMLPSAFVVMEALPLTPNGKVDRRALPPPDHTIVATDKKYVAPRTPVEEIVAGICAEVLGLEHVSVEDNFFELGGHSLLAAQVISRVREAFEVELSLRNLFLKPTVLGLARNIEQALRAGRETLPPRIERVSREIDLPLSFAQQRLWFLDQLEPDSSFYNIHAAVRMCGVLNIKALERALTELIRRHETLRTTFADVDGEPVQVIAPARAETLTVERVPGQDRLEQEAHVRRLAKEEAERPFNLNTGPLLRVRLLRITPVEHITLLTMHHIISDGWSMGVLVREIAALYSAYSREEAPQLAELEVQYGDFAVWQRRWLKGEVLEEQVGYWREQLRGAAVMLELPTDHPRPAAQSYRGAHERFALPAQLTQRLSALSRSEGATLFITLLAAFKILLARYSGQQDIVVGTDMANRTRAETEALIGFFVNMIVLRTDLSGNPSFVELLGRVREVALEAYAHQDVPFEKLVEELQPKRTMSHSPLFNVVFVLQNAPMGALEAPGLVLSPHEFESDFTRFDLECHLWEHVDGLKGFLIYNADLFEAVTIRRLLENFQTLLGGIAANPEQRIGSLPLLTSEEKEQLVFQWNRTATDYPRDLSASRQFEQQVEQRPDAIAIVSGDQQLTYSELNRQANQLAHYLRSLGVGPEVPVAICVERSLEMVIGLLGILKAGGFYVPLDPAYPLKRLAFMLEDAQAPVLLTQEHLAGELPAHWGQIVQLDADREMIAAESEENLAVEVSGDNLIYMLYTSGSTGQPKGVSATHRGVMRLVKGTTFAKLSADEIFLQLAPLSFDASTFEIWGSLLNGARLVLMPPQSPSLEQLEAALSRHRVTTLWLTAGLFHLVVAERVEALRPLRQLLAGGDVLSVPHVEKVLHEINGCTLINGYGPTESTTFACCYTIPRDGFQSLHTPIGRPISNTQVYLLDERMQPVPIGVAGELHIGGDGLARGYHRRPDLTAERFVPHPFSDQEGARLYRTGDLARYLKDGEIEFLGRLDQQVKIRGFRIELGEIEAALAEHPAVRESVVVVHEGEGGDKQLIAYVAGEEASQLSASEWRAFLQERLPDYMMPAHFLALAELPLTPNGKVNKRALPSPETYGGADAAGAFVAARTPVEEVLVGIWADVLGLERISIEDDFFELGGHSLLATRVVSRAVKAFGVELPLRSLFENPTVDSLAAYIEAAVREGAEMSAPPLCPVRRDQEVPLSFAQQRLWFLSQLEPDSPFYNIPIAVRLDGKLSVDALEQTLNEIIRRHEVLRTTFASLDGRPMQVIHPPSSISLKVEEVSGSSETERQSELHKLIFEEAQRPFDLSKGPLLRVRLLRITPVEHITLLTMHHIISDGWSMGVLVREIAALYSAYSREEAPQLAELEVQYGDFAVWQRRWLKGEVLEEQVGYWREQLRGAAVMLELPTDRPRPPVQTFDGATETQVLDAAMAEKIRRLGQQEEATPFMVLLAAFDVLLYRLSRQRDISVGTPIANRNRAETEALIGFFVNTLVLRTQIEDGENFAELLRRVREATLGAYAHQDLPFEKLVEELQPARDLSRSPLFQVMLALQNAPREELILPGLSLTALETESATEKFDLTLTLAETEEGYRSAWTYNTNLFEATTIKRLVSHWQVLLEGIVADPQQRVSRLPLLAEQERKRLLFDWNETTAEFPEKALLHELVEAQVERTPDAVALIFEDEQISYGELNRRANQLAHYLRGQGVGPDALVGILLERSIEMVVGLLGILKAGGAYLPLDPNYPRERLRFMMSDSRARWLLTQERLRDVLPATQAQVICLDTGWEKMAGESTENPVQTAEADNLIYVIYTSGSTGVPKGAMLSHRAIVNCTTWMQRVYGLHQGDRFLCKTSLNFDPSVWEVFWPLWTGGQVVLARAGGQQDSAYLAELMVRHQVTIAYFVPSMLSVFLDEPAAFKVTSLRYVICGGESLNGEAIERFYDRMGHAELHHSYGPTETAIKASEITCVPESGMSLVPIGRPIANVRFYVLDEELQPVPVGVIGELYIGGVCVGRGYLNRAELTAERFIPDPFGEEPGARLYRTGDLVRYLPNGNVEFAGRTDHQVKVRGLRIELGEIEAALQESPGVREVVVLAREDIAGDKRLVAYVVGEREETVNVGELRQQMRTKLPEYMIPSAFVMLAALPLMSNGKVDRDALPAPETARPELAETYAAPQTPVEEMLADLWADVLGIAEVGVNDNFFELGGHSLLATQVISRVRTTFQIELPLRRLFETPTVAGLAQQVEAQISSRSLRSSPILPVSREQAIPLSFAQQRLWFLDQLENAGAAYHIPSVFRVSGRLSLHALEQTLNEIVRRHEALRTTFKIIGGEPRQLIAPFEPLQIRVENLESLSETERETEAGRLAAEETERQFDLEHGPLVRTLLLRLSAEDHVLVVTMHHIASDGWSRGILAREVMALYPAFLTGTASPLPELKVQYADYAVWQRAWLQDEVLDEQLAYWRTQLGGSLPVLELPTDFPRPSVQTFDGAQLSFALSKELTEGLAQLSRSQNVTLFMTLLAAFQTLLYRSTEQEEIVVGVPIANRNRGEIESLIGFFVNTLALRTNLSETPSFTELLRRVRETALGAYAHQDVPFERLVEELQPERDLSRNPLFQVLFVLQNTPLEEFKLPGLSIAAQQFESDSTRFDLELHLWERAEGLQGFFIYNTALFEAATIGRLLGHFQTLLENIVLQPEQDISKLPWLTADEEERLLTEYNPATVEPALELCVHELFAQQVERTPDAIALEDGDAQLSYAELNARANGLAHRLRRMGVGADSIVAILIERSIEMALSVLAVLKAGGAYLPLDPEYPQERLRFMLDDAKVPVLLTQQSLLGTIPETGAQVLCVESDQEALNVESEQPVSAATAENLAYLIYTSGSTGQPKGVAMTHRALVNLVNWQVARSATIPAPRTLQFASLSFDVSFQEMFSTWRTGATLVIAREEVRRDTKQLLSLLRERRIERLFLPFVALQYLAEVAETEGTVPVSLRQVITAGEQLKITRSIRGLFGKLEGCTLDNHYGPSETHAATAYLLEGPVSDWPELPPIGRPLSNLQIYLLDQHMQLVPMGVAGELYIGGEALARGYLARPEATAEKFVPHPFAAERGLRLYRTGDLARYLTDGNLQFLGRRDFQVKVRGYRIETGEVEAALRQYAAIEEAVVMPHQNPRGEKRLVAYLRVAGEAEVKADQLRDHLKERLPEYMIPSLFFTLPEFPLTPSGKVNRRALPAPDQLEDEAAESYVAPRRPHEEIVAGIWADVLKLERVGVNDNFFELGGHSLLATQVMSRIRESFGIELPLRRLFEAPTVNRLVESIEAALLAKDELTPAPPIKKASRAGHLPLSFAQQRLWFWDQLEPGSTTYNLTHAIRLRGQLKTAALKQSLNEIIRRHEILRTTFKAMEEQPVQIINPVASLMSRVRDLSYLPPEERETEARRLVQEQTRQPFDLARGPLLRVNLYRLGEEEHVASLSMHHIISDGWSMGVLVREVAALYEAFAMGQPSPLPELPVQYADFAVWQREQLQGDMQQPQLSYWKKQLEAAPKSFELPTDYPRPKISTSRGAAHLVRFPSDLTRALRAISRQEGVTLYMTLLAAFQILLHRYTLQTDVIVGTDVANRNRIEIEGLIGFFVNMLVLRTNLSGDPSFLELLQQVREVSLGAYAHQDIPFDKLVEELHVEREGSKNPLFQIIFVLQNAPLEPLVLPGLTLSPFPYDNDIAPFDLLFALYEEADGLSGSLVYRTELFSEATIERLLDHYRTLLESIVADPEQSLSSLRLLDETETGGYSPSDFSKVKLKQKDLENLFIEINRTSGAD